MSLNWAGALFTQLLSVLNTTEFPHLLLVEQKNQVHIQRANYELYADFSLCGNLTPML